MRKRSVTAVLVATAIAVPALPAVLASPATAKSAVTVQAADASRSPRLVEHVKRPGKKVPVRVVVVAHGRLATVDTAARTLAVTVRGDRTLTGTVAPLAVVRRNGKKVELTALATGDRVVVQGWRTGTTVTFTRVTARSAQAETPAPAPTPAPTTPGDDGSDD